MKTKTQAKTESSKSKRKGIKDTVSTSEPTFIDLFAGIGGFHLAFHRLGVKCVFASEWDEDARKTYIKNFRDVSPHLFKEGVFADGQSLFAGDIKEVEESDIPDFNILTGGFPCQAFSQAGYKKGFEDTRGTLFFDIARILEEKQPEAFFIENVRYLKNHNDGETFEIIKKIIEEDLDYSFHHYVVKAKDYGLPQLRPRLFMIGFKDKSIEFDPPEEKPLKYDMSDILGGDCEREVGYTLRVGGRRSGIDDRRNWDAYRVDGEVVVIGPEEGKKMMGLPDNFEFPVSDAKAMKQLGNSVAVDAVEAFAENLFNKLAEHYELGK
jgi:DNA (cytosine-5)-methyltransferase 1